MPYTSTKIKIQGTKHDRRVKLTPEQKQEISTKYATGLYSQRELAREYNVSRRLITFIIDPAKHKANLAARKAKGGSKQYYDKDKHTEAIRTHRRYKQALYKKGDIVLKEDKNSCGEGK